MSYNKIAEDHFVLNDIAASVPQLYHYSAYYFDVLFVNSRRRIKSMRCNITL